MSRKHFEQLAAALRLGHDAIRDNTATGQDPEALLADVTHAIADACAASNPNFDRARFLQACGAAR